MAVVSTHRLDESLYSHLSHGRIRLYILEGLVTIIVGGFCVFLIPKDYQTAYFLTAEEKDLMHRRAEQSKTYSGGEGHYKMADVKLAAKDIKTWVHGITQICVVTILYGMKPPLYLGISGILTMFNHRLRHFPSNYSKKWLQLFHKASSVPYNPRFVTKLVVQD